MKKYARSSYDLFDDCYDECLRNMIVYVKSGDPMSYDDVVSETYAQIQTWYEMMDEEDLLDAEEDELYESIMWGLDDEGLIDNNRGLLIYE